MEPSTGNGASKRAVISGSLGSALEYFDFAVYGALSAALFPKLFFDGISEEAALLVSLATFGVGFVARPAGALLFSHLGDRIGRHPVLYITLMTMSISSIAIGLLPTGQGAAVAILLVILRFIQGFSLGGEATGNQIMSMEHASIGKRGFFGSIVNLGSPASQVVANLVLAGLTATLSEQQWESWGWRVPFLASILLVLVTIYIRYKLEETPAFKASQEEQKEDGSPRESSLRVLVSHPRTICKLALTWAGPCMTANLVAIYGLSYLHKELGVPTDTTFIVLVLANVVGSICCILGGRLSDVIGRKPTVAIGLVVAIVGTVGFFTLAAESSSTPMLVLLTSIPIASVQWASGVQPALFAEQFPTPIRFAGSAMSYTISTLLFAAPAPFLGALLVSIGGPYLIMGTTVLSLVVSLIALSMIKERSNLDLVAFTSYETEADAVRAQRH